MSLTLSQLSRISPTERDQAYLDSELGFYAAYKQHLNVAQFLRSGGFDREAYYSLRVSIECYLKDIFCIFRFRIFGDLREIQRKVLREQLYAASFSHDLSQLSSILRTLCPDIYKDEKYILFHSKLPPGPSWISERYDNPATIKQNYTLLYDELYAAFIAVIDGTLGGIK